MSKRLAPLPLIPLGVHTCYDLLTHVARLIVEEPERLHMGWFVSRYRGDDSECAGFGIDHLKPACDTVGCLSGWISMNARIPNPLDHRSKESYAVLGALVAATEDEQEAVDPLTVDLWELFYGIALDGFNPIGSRKYAKQYATRVRAVRDKHRRRLKARVIKIKRDGYEVVSA